MGVVSPTNTEKHRETSFSDQLFCRSYPPRVGRRQPCFRSSSARSVRIASSLCHMLHTAWENICSGVCALPLYPVDGHQWSKSLEPIESIHLSFLVLLRCESSVSAHRVNYHRGTRADGLPDPGVAEPRLIHSMSRHLATAPCPDFLEILLIKIRRTWLDQMEVPQTRV